MQPLAPRCRPSQKLSPPQPGSPKLTLTGTLVFGEVIVYGSKHITLSDRIQGNF